MNENNEKSEKKAADLGTHEVDEFGRVKRSYPGGNLEAAAEAGGRIGEIRRPVRSDELLTLGDYQILRRLVTDRIEERFRAAGKAASEMSVPALLNITEEIKNLDALWEKLKKLDKSREDAL